MRDVVQYQWNDPLPDDQHQQQVCSELDGGQAEHAPERVWVQKTAEPTDIELLRGLAAQHRCERRKQNENKHHRQIFDDQPAYDDAPPVGVDEAALLHRAQDDDRAGDGQCQAEYDACTGGPTHQFGEAESEC